MMRNPIKYLTLGLITASLFIDGTGVLHAEASKPDERLLKTISYEGGYQRLHTVADDISKQTGVKIWCGKSLEDWRVRDIPVIVYANDITLIKLLQSIATATHCQLAEVKVDSDKPKTYRIYRTRKMEAELEGTLRAREDANLAVASWAWDTLVSFANMPNSTYSLPDPPANASSWEKKRLSAIDMEQIKLVAKILSSLGADDKEKALAGEQITLTIGTNPLRKQLFSYSAKHRNTRWGESAPASEEDIAASTIIIKINRGDRASTNCGFSFLIYGIPYKVRDNESDISKDCWDTNPVELAKALKSIKELNLPPMPDVGSVFRENNDTLGPPLKQLMEDDWKTTLMQAKVNIQVPKEVKEPKRQDVLKELSAKSGFSIVIEDFLSHKDITYSCSTTDFSDDSTVASVLRRMDKTNWKRPLWYIDEQTKLLVGRESEWRKSHNNLVPETLLTGIRQKRLTSGAELDDLTPLLRLTREQFDEWVSSTSDFYNWRVNMSEGEQSIWQLYDSLTSSEKALAKSEAGLPLTTIDPVWISEFCKQSISESNRGVIHLYTDYGIDYVKKEKETLTNPEIVKNLVMYVTEVPGIRWNIVQLEDGAVSYTPSDKGPKKHTYKIQLKGEVDGKEIGVDSTWYDIAFPLFTMEKELELAKIKSE